jgi:hypothetical protein
MQKLVSHFGGARGVDRTAESRLLEPSTRPARRLRGRRDTAREARPLAAAAWPACAATCSRKRGRFYQPEIR